MRKLIIKKTGVTLNKAKYYYGNDKERKSQARNKYKNLSGGEKIKRENMQEIDAIICLTKRNKNQKNIKKLP